MGRRTNPGLNHPLSRRGKGRCSSSSIPRVRNTGEYLWKARGGEAFFLGALRFSPSHFPLLPLPASQLISPPYHPRPSPTSERHTDVQAGSTFEYRSPTWGLATHVHGTSCHYADALYSVGYTAVRKMSAAPFQLMGARPSTMLPLSSNGRESRHGRPGATSSRR